MVLLFNCILLFIWAAVAAGLPLLDQRESERLRNLILQSPEGVVGTVLLAGSLLGAGSVLLWQGVAETLQARRAAQTRKEPAQCGPHDNIFFPKDPDPMLAPDDPSLWGGQNFADILRGSAKREKMTPQQQALLRAFDEGLRHATLYFDEAMSKTHWAGHDQGRRHGYSIPPGSPYEALIRYRDGLYAGTNLQGRPLIEREAHMDGYQAGWNYGVWLQGQPWSRYVAAQDAYQNGQDVGKCAKQLYSKVPLSSLLRPFPAVTVTPGLTRMQWMDCNKGKATLQQIHDWTLHCLEVVRKERFSQASRDGHGDAHSSQRPSTDPSPKEWTQDFRAFFSSALERLSDGLERVPAQIGNYAPRPRPKFGPR